MLSTLLRVFADTPATSDATFVSLALSFTIGVKVVSPSGLWIVNPSLGFVVMVVVFGTPSLVSSEPFSTSDGLSPVSAFAALDETGFMPKVCEALTHRVVDDGEDAGAGRLIAQGVEDRNRLRRAESNVIAKDGLDSLLSAVRALSKLGVRALDELLASGGIGAFKDGAVRLCLDLAGQAKLGGQLADPFAGRLARLVVVVLPAFGDGGEPVPGVAALNLRDTDHAEGVRSGSTAPRELANPCSGFIMCRLSGVGCSGRFELGQLPYLSAGKLAQECVGTRAMGRFRFLGIGRVTGELRAGRVKLALRFPHPRQPPRPPPGSMPDGGRLLLGSL